MNIADIKGKVDFALLTIKQEELEAILDKFPLADPEHIVQGTREYNLSFVLLKMGTYLVASVRARDQGNGEMETLVGDIFRDLNPRVIIVVGIGGAVPHADLTLGDVVVSMNVIDMRLGARDPDGAAPRAPRGGAIMKEIATMVANLPARRRLMTIWNEPPVLSKPPSFDHRLALAQLEKDLGDVAHPWYVRVKKALEHHYGAEHHIRAPIQIDGTIASSDDVIKDWRVADAWLKNDRTIKIVDMESGGALRGANDAKVPFLAIRAVSDIISIKRDEAWTVFACKSAAAFMHSWISAGPIPPVPERSRLRTPTPPPSAHTPPAPIAAPPPAIERELLIAAHNFNSTKTLHAYANRSSEPNDYDAQIAILKRLNAPWRQPLSEHEAALLAVSSFRPGVHYPSAPYVLDRLHHVPSFLASVADAIRATARWPDSYRLNYVRQLSTTSLSCSLDANHSRLAHCLGVLDVATCLVAALARTSPDFLDLDNNDARKWTIATLLFAFLHDRYHGPLGHSLDPMSFVLMIARSPSPTEPQSVMHKLDKVALADEVSAALREPSHPIYRVVEFVVSRLATTGISVRTHEILKALQAFVRFTKRSDMPPEWRFLQDVVDGELDADRIDYLWRDSLHISSQHPLVAELLSTLGQPSFAAVGAVIASAKVIAIQGEHRLAFDAAHTSAIAALSTLRFIYYVHVYENPVKRVHDELLVRTIQAALEAGALIQDGRVISRELSDELRLLTDGDLIHFLYEAANRTGSARVEQFKPIPNMVHEVMQARPWDIVWESKLTSGGIEQERLLREQLLHLTSSIARASSSAVHDQANRSVVIQRDLAIASMTGTLAEFLESHGISEVPALIYTESSAVYDFFMSYHGSLESRRQVELSLWEDIIADPEMKDALEHYRIQLGLANGEKLPCLITMGMVSSRAPKLPTGDVLVYPCEAETTVVPDAWTESIRTTAVLHTFFAVHPLLLHKRAKIEAIINLWFRRLGHLGSQLPAP